MTDAIVPQKRCSRCQQEKPATHEYFTYDKSRPDGFYYCCRECYRKPAPLSNIPDGYKLCSTCNQIYPATTEYFYARGNGVVPPCKVCKSENRRKRLQNPEIRALVNQREKARRANPEKKEYHRRYRQNPAFKEKERYRSKKRWEDPKYRLQKKLQSIRYYDRKRSLPNTLTVDNWLKCLEYWHGCCAVCGGQLRDLFGYVEPNIDHWIPLNSPDCPGTIPTNIICLCESCNKSKGDAPANQWLISRYGKRKANTILKRIEAYFEWIKQQ